MKKRLLSIAIFLLFLSPLFAQSPESFNYQAVIRDSGGNTIPDQSVGLQFTIRKTSATGTVVYKETFTKTTNGFGLVNLKIGMGSVQSGDFETIDWGNDSFYLETAVDTNGGSNYDVMGTSQMVSVPYALYAKSAGDSYWKTKPGGGIAYTDGNIGIGTSNVAAADKVQIYTDTNNENVVNLRLINKNADYFSRLLFNNNQTNNFVIGLNGSNYQFGANEAFIWYFEDFDLKIGTGGLERMRIKNDGKIGIGTAAPGSQLQVKGGDIYIEDANKGVIMKSPNGSCFRLTVDDSGNPVFTSITCPAGN